MKIRGFMRRSIPGATVYMSFALALIIMAATVNCCASQPADTSITATTSSGMSVAPTTTTGGNTTTTSPLVLSEYEKELAKTATVRNQLSVYLQERQATEEDPRTALVFALSARTQALTCRKAIADNDLELANSAMKDVYSTINVALSMATGTTATVLTDAKNTIASVGAPSDKPDQAAILLDQFIAQLAPLLDEATAITASTTTT